MVPQDGAVGSPGSLRTGRGKAQAGLQTHVTLDGSCCGALAHQTPPNPAQFWHRVKQGPLKNTWVGRKHPVPPAPWE